MKWSDYEFAWKRQELPKGVDADLAKLHETFEKKSGILARAIQVRDWSEIAACIFVISFYLWYWDKVGTEGWPMVLSIGFILIIAGIYICERSRVRRIRLGVDVPLIMKVKADLEELQHQRRLMSNAWLWYLAPGLGAMVAHCVVIMRHLPDWTYFNSVSGRLAIGFFIVLIGCVIWWMFRRAIRIQIDPRIIELEKLRDDILSETKCYPIR